MNESANRGNISDLVAAEQAVKVITSEMTKHKANADKWMINFTVNLEQDPEGKYTVEIAGATGNGRGHRITLSNEDVLKYAPDPGTIARHIADVMLGRILVEVTRDAVAPQISRAIENAAKLSSGKSSL